MSKILDALSQRISNAIAPKPPEEKKELVDEYDMLMAKFERDLGKFPFAALWPMPQESSIVKIISIVNLVVLLVIMITVFVK